MHNARCTLMISVVLLGACAGRVETKLRKTAAEDMSCPADTIQVEARHSATSKGRNGYRVHGCDKTQVYMASCNLLFCKAAPLMAGATPVDDPENIRGTPEERRRAEDAKPKQLKYKVFNQCDKRVTLKRGNDASVVTRDYWLDPNDVKEVEGFKDDNLWIVGRVDSPGGLIKLNPDKSMLYIDASCTAFRQDE